MRVPSTEVMFFTAAELVDLTGYKTGKRQCAWLAENGYSFDVRADGRPALTRAAFEARHELTRTRRRPSALNLAALKELQ